MNVLRELHIYRKNLRKLKADNLRSMRYYKREYGPNDSVASFMSGMATGKTAALMSLDCIIQRLEREEKYGNG
tara:strand:- start:2790 stop:3008 length:219 start_codon:yes stop_codon:yes gene_type:complete